MYTKTDSADGPARSAEQVAYEYLRDGILAGRLPGGTPLRQEDIAARLGLSRIPIRDALRLLAARGLVTFESSRRAVVTLLQESDLSELFEMRAVLEGLAVRHAVAQLTRQDLDRLAWLANRMDETEATGDLWMPSHDEFHDLICDRSGMPRLAGEIKRLRQRVEPYVRILIMVHGAAELRLSRHDSLLRVLRSGDPNQAEQALRGHVMQATREIRASLRSSQLAPSSHANAEMKKPAEPRPPLRRTAR
jgi:DNA-binding GntR family transcriptional regulator